MSSPRNPITGAAARALPLVLALAAAPSPAGAQATLVHHFPLDDSPALAGSTVAAAVGASGTLFSAGPGSHAAPGHHGGALWFDGTTRVVAPGVDLDDDDFSIAAWIRPVGTNRGVLAAQGGYCCFNGYVFDVPGAFSGGTAALRCEVVPPCFPSIQAPAAVTLGEWQHVALSAANNGPQVLYRNGVEVARTSINYGDITNLTLVIGDLTQGCHGAGWVGYIDDLRIYRGALTASEVIDAMAGGGDVTPPVISCPPDALLEAGPLCTASGPIGVATAIDDRDPSPDVTSDAPASFPLGATTVTWTATDDAGNSSTCTQLVTVVDATPPAISAVAPTPGLLWPPNHRMVRVEVAAQATDNCSPAVCRAVAVASSEPVDGPGDGDTEGDWTLLGGTAVELRAERSGAGAGRVYTLTVECADAAGNASTAAATVTVPHDRR